MREVGDRIDPSRLHFLGRIDHDNYRALLQRFRPARLPYLPIRRFLVAQGSTRHRLRRARQRHAPGAGIHHP